MGRPLEAAWEKVHEPYWTKVHAELSKPLSTQYPNCFARVPKGDWEYVEAFVKNYKAGKHGPISVDDATALQNALKGFTRIQ